MLAHDWLVGMRGGEMVLDRLARLFGPTDLYTMVADERCEMSDAIRACRVHTSEMQHWPGGPGSLRRWYLPLYPAAVQSLSVHSGPDLLISTSSALIKAIKPPTDSHGRLIPHICYCHTPPRYLWEMSTEYAHGAGGTLRTLGLASFGPALRAFDRSTNETVTQFVANSRHTAARIKRCYERDAVVIHPPVRTEYFTVDEQVERGGHYLVVSALEPYKRVDLAVQAAAKLNRELVVIGDGSQRAHLEQLAAGHPSVRFLGWLPAEQLLKHYRTARALLFPGIEDFGIVPVEAMACGCPVIAQQGGGADDWMIEPETGVTFNEATVESLVNAITRFESNPDQEKTQTSRACRENAERFAESEFDQIVLDLAARVLERSSSA
ncbi:MAG: glycosyltransferase [Planctomycetes bacterium]|nr:glycosyltransferase [Planctomycetota bacterium]